MLTTREVRIAKLAGISAAQYFGPRYCFRHFRDCFSWYYGSRRTVPKEDVLFGTPEKFKEGFLISKRAAKALRLKLG